MSAYFTEHGLVNYWTQIYSVKESFLMYIAFMKILEGKPGGEILVHVGKLLHPWCRFLTSVDAEQLIAPIIIQDVVNLSYEQFSYIVAVNMKDIYPSETVKLQCLISYLDE